MRSIFQDILSKSGGGFNPPSFIYRKFRGGGGVATRPPPTLLLWRPWHMRIYPFIYSFIVFVYVFINSFIQLFIHSQRYFNLFLYRSVVHVHVYYNTQGRIGPAAPPPFGRWAPGSTMHFLYELICCETYLIFPLKRAIICHLEP